MSYQLGIDALNLKPTSRVARTECNDNDEIIRHYTGRDPRVDPTAWHAFNERIDMDFIFNTPDISPPWEQRGRITDMGHAEFVEGGTDFHLATESPFKDADEVLAFNAIDEYGLDDLDQLTAQFEDLYQRSLTDCPYMVVPGGYYRTIVSGAIAIFGWDRLLEAAAVDPQRFGKCVLGSIADFSVHVAKAWARTSAPYFLTHDDMVWTAGPFMNPKLYREYIFPRYAQIWKIIHDAGKRVLYCADGTYDMFVDDLIDAGADGFLFEPSNDLDKLIKRCGGTYVLMGGADCRTLTFGTRADIKREMTTIYDKIRDVPGFFFTTGNHLPANIPLENLIYYFDLCEELGQR